MEKELNEYFREITQGCYAAMEERLEKYELVKGQAYLLITIRDNDGATQKDLANILGVRYSSMSERLDKLEKSGLIERTVDENNLKFKRIFITKQGKIAVVQCKRIMQQFEKVLYKGFSKKDKTQLEDYLKKLIKNLNR
jgi:DNA-binding MarR family transcriptional regulator